MTKNQTVMIERVGNGYIVKPFIPHDKGLFSINEIMVFQDKGIASPERDNQETKDTLFGFLDLHFSDNEKEYNRSLE